MTAPEKAVQAAYLDIVKDLMKDVVNIQSQILSLQSDIRNTQEEQRSMGEIYPTVESISDTEKTIEPIAGTYWKEVSVYNRGDNDCTLTIKIKGRPKTLEVSLLSRVSKDFKFSRDLIESVSAECASGESCTLELEFKR